MKLFTPNRLVVIAGLCVALGACGGSEPSSPAPDATEWGVPITLRESVPNSAFQPEGVYKVIAGTIVRREIDGVTALRALFTVQPPKGVELEPPVSNPQRIADGDLVPIGPCTYRFDIDEDEHLVTLVPIDGPSPGACGAG